MALDADSFTQCEQATASLIKLGASKDVLPALRSASKHPSLEVRLRVARIIEQIKVVVLHDAFTKLAQTKNDADIDLEHGMWLIARIETPDLDRKTIDQQLDQLAAEVRAVIGNKNDPSKLPPAKVVEAIRSIIFTKHGFTGDTETYRTPANSLIDQVLKRRKGLPILLSHVVVSVGTRLKVPIVGLQIPGKYMVKYDGSRSPRDHESKDIIIDAYGGGRILTVEELSKEISTFEPTRHLLPSGKRDSLTRMMRNLETHYASVGRHGKAKETMRYRIIMETYPNLKVDERQ